MEHEDDQTPEPVKHSDAERNTTEEAEKTPGGADQGSQSTASERGGGTPSGPGA